MSLARHRATVLGTEVDVIDWDAALERISAWGRARESRDV